MTTYTLREKYITFFTQSGHTEISGQSLLPENDPTVLFTTAGMHPLTPYLLGQEHPAGKQLVNYQRCIRTGDIEMVGDDSHLTFFEMLGNWSIRNYFKEEAIAMSYEFLCSDKWLNIPPEKIVISVFAGDDQVPADEASVALWKNLGIPASRIFYLPRSDNWWGPAGLTGPCGPDTEMFIDTQHGTRISDLANSPSRYLEIWNDVFMEYNKQADGSYTKLQLPCVDTGMGLERTAAILQNKHSVYEIELIAPLMQALATRCTLDTKASMRIVADHLRAACFIIGDEYGVLPSNLGQGYVLRRLIRRASRHLKKLGPKDSMLHSFIPEIINVYAPVYPRLQERQEFIVQELEREERQFMLTLDRGEREFMKLLPRFVEQGKVSGKQAFTLYDTFGFPVELTEELAGEHNISVDVAGFEVAFKEHQDISRQDQKSSFKGGLSDHSDSTTKLHTATHLLQQALSDVLGDHVQQKGSNITHDRLRFDFLHDEKLTDDEIKAVEDIVNEKIQDDLPVTTEFMSLEEAKEKGARAFFVDRYASQVSVYSIGDYSMEVCGGPHVSNTKELGYFKIVKEQSSSRGVRRIKAVLE